ncbi:hypothetical protein LAZ29_16465 [Cereibacter sphaeroides]|uniref:hypothetical protein n=1 Tax=Cereibacter sphaeroides TaxID=1063 RepID=UPI001F1637C2|nr:hypothetical protein [Cereibacter sphaeroides]MCE6952528.1 hypothetical protein [Cereibacter sphaeroides]
MPHTRVLNIYLPSPMREDAVAGKVNIINRIQAAVATRGLAVDIHPDTPEDRANPARRQGWSLFHMQEPVGPRCLCLRRAYHYPFWQIEATNERWWFDVARKTFDPAEVEAAAARPFYQRWRRRIVGERKISRDGFIFMPLQGRLGEHRSFQAMSPIAMIHATLDHDPRPIRATLHPKEHYTSSDLHALEDLIRRYPRLDVSRADPLPLLAACDLVVTQNSSVALTGYFMRKPAVLFAGIDFHHIAGSVPREGVAQAFARAEGTLPDHEAYLYWFFQLNTINGGSPEAEAQILSRFDRHGWHF